MIEWFLNTSPYIIVFWIGIIGMLLYIGIRIISFAIVRSFFDAKRDYYNQLKKKLHKGE